MTNIKAISLSHEGFGSLDWELPASISNNINSLPQGAQDWIMAELEKQLKACIFTLMGAVQSGTKAPNAFAIMDMMGSQTLKLLKADLQR